MESRSVRETAQETTARFDLVYTLIALAGAALIGWAISLIPNVEEIKSLVWILAGVTSAIYLGCYANAGTSRSATVIRYTSWTMLLLSNFVLAMMSIWCVTTTYFTIVSAALALLFIAIVYSVAKANQ